MTTIAEIDFKSYYIDPLYIDANVETGVIYNRSGRRMIALTNDFLIGLHRALEKECGERASAVLYHCGKKWGGNFARGLDAEWSQFYGTQALEFPFAFFHSLIVQEFAHNGWGILELDVEHSSRGVIGIGLYGAIMADISETAPDYPTDILTAGILAGLFSHFFKHDLSVVQTEIGRNVEEASRFLLSETSRIEQIRGRLGDGKDHTQILASLLDTTPQQ